jgi:adenine-specific DNA-methyltransferase
VPCVFASAYETPAAETPAAETPAAEGPAAEGPAAEGQRTGGPDAVPSLFDGLVFGRESVVEHDGRRVAVRVGRLSARTPGDPWRVSHPAGDEWLARIESRTWRTFGDIARIRVGIKTTADGVFIGDDWDALPVVPEVEILLPLITHHDVVPWAVSPTPRTRVLYPYDLSRDRRHLLDMTQYPRAMAYLEQHRGRLAGRSYVLEAGREWFEIWVPQRPSRWAAPKLVFPDISDTPRFAYDRTGAVVNGDCYWISLDDIGSEDVACLMLAVANSELGCTFYDEVCGNRLYSGRRRWITQYVARLPVPDPELEVSQEIVRNVTDLLEGRAAATAERRRRVSRLVEAAFAAPSAVRPRPHGSPSTRPTVLSEDAPNRRFGEGGAGLRLG